MGPLAGPGEGDLAQRLALAPRDYIVKEDGKNHHLFSGEEESGSRRLPLSPSLLFLAAADSERAFESIP